MLKLSFTQPHNLSVLHQELIDQIPGFHRTIVAGDGQVEAAPDCGSIESKADQVRVTFPDDIPGPSVTSVVQSHDPSVVQADPGGERLARINELICIPKSTWTTAQLRELVYLLGVKGTT